jgi:hypothetical protein
LENYKEQQSYQSLTKKQKEKFDLYSQELLQKGFDEEDAYILSLNKAKRFMTKASKTLPLIKATDDEQMLAIEVVYEPFVPDAHGQWMSDVTVRKACEDFNQKLSEGKIKSNLFHIYETDSFEIVKSWINEVECTIGEERIPEGTWLCSVQYKSAELWEMLKSGEIGGVSICANGTVEIKETQDVED